MSKKFLTAVGIILAAFCFIFIVLKGDTCTYSFAAGDYPADDISVTAENGNVEIVNKEAIQKLGAKGIVEIENQLKIILGPDARQLKKYIDAIK